MSKFIINLNWYENKVLKLMCCLAFANSGNHRN